MGYFHTYNANLGIFWKALGLKIICRYVFHCHSVFFCHVVYVLYGHLVYYVAIWYILWPSWYKFFHFGLLCEEKSGNPSDHLIKRFFTSSALLFFLHKHNLVLKWQDLKQKLHFTYNKGDY
jgi:hypothetical protein